MEFYSATTSLKRSLANLCVRLAFTAAYACFGRSSALGIENCPMESVKAVIGRTLEFGGLGQHSSDAVYQMQMIRRVMEDIFGGSWGVLIVKDFDLIASSVHWTFPEQKHDDASPAFCLHVERGWQYNVFKTGEADTPGRVTIEEVLRRLNNQGLMLSTSPKEPPPSSSLPPSHKKLRLMLGGGGVATTAPTSVVEAGNDERGAETGGENDQQNGSNNNAEQTQGGATKKATSTTTSTAATRRRLEQRAKLLLTAGGGSRQKQER